MAETEIVDLQRAYDEFSRLKSQNVTRNKEYFLLRQAVMGNFEWPSTWPNHIDKVKHNLCKPISERFVTYLMAKGFSWNIERPNTVEWRQKAEVSEKILDRILKLSRAGLQFDMGAKVGSQLGRTVYKTYKTGAGGKQHACFTYCQPDYFYGVPAGDNALGDFATVYYSYPIDHLEAVRLFGVGDYKTEGELSRGNIYDPMPEQSRSDANWQRDRRVPVLEIWNKESYALVVGGVVKWNGRNPNRVKASGEGFIPFTVIENIRNAGEGAGEADISQARHLNNRLNWLLSRKGHIVNRWLVPTVVWEGAPQNYAEILSNTVGGGGAIGSRIGSRLSFLAYDRPNPAVQELEMALRTAILETAGLNELALQGTMSGSVNTGPSVAARMMPTSSAIEMKRREWGMGLAQLFSQLLEIQESIGDSEILGQVVVNSSIRGSNKESDGQLVDLSGKDIEGLREVTIDWPGILPKDDIEAARFEVEKASKGLQSVYTTLEKLGDDFPYDEITRIREENQDPALRGQAVAEQMRAQAPVMQAQVAQQKAQADHQLQQQQMAQDAQQQQQDQQDNPPNPDQGGVGAVIRALAQRRQQPRLDQSGDQPTVTSGAIPGY